MSERLRHLQRQRALLGEHLAWIEREIARENPAGPAAPADTSASAATHPAPALAPASADDADALIETYAAGERQNPADIRRGCFYVFASALILLVAGTGAMWLLFYR